MGGRVHLGDLLRALHSAPAGSEGQAAQAAGFVLRAPASGATIADDAQHMAQALLAEAGQTTVPAAQRETASQPTPPAPAPEEATAPPAPQFWRVRSILPKPARSAEPPAWFSDSPAPISRFLTDRSQPLPARPWLQTPGQWAHSSRTSLSRHQTVAQWCERRLSRSLALGQPLPPAHALRKQLVRWPHTLQVVQDLDERHCPLDHEFDHWVAQLYRHFGQRLRLQRVRGLPSATVGQGPAARADGSPVLVFSNLGADAEGIPHPEWLALAQRITQAGGKAWVWWPGTVLSDAARAVGWLAWPLTATSAPTQPEQASTWPAERLLCCAIWGNPQVSPGLLRRLRLAACAQGFGLTPLDEVRLWHCERVLSDAYACRLLPEANAQVQTDWQLLPQAVRQAWVQLHLSDLAAASPLVRAEFAEAQAQAWGDEARPLPALQQARQEGEALMQAAANALHSQQEGLLSRELQAFVQRQTQRLPKLPEKAPEAWQWAWGLSHRQAWQANPALRPDWMTAEMRAHLCEGAPAPVRQFLAVQTGHSGATLTIHSGDAFRARIAEITDEPQVQYKIEPEPLLRRQARALRRFPSGELRNFLSDFSRFYPPGNDDNSRQRKQALEASQEALLEEFDASSEEQFLRWEQEFLGWRRAMAVHVGPSLLDNAIDDATGSMGFIERFPVPPLRPLRRGELQVPSGASVRLEWPSRTVVVEPFTRLDWLDSVRCEAGVWRGLTLHGQSVVWLPEVSLGVANRPEGERVRFGAAWWSTGSLDAINANKMRHVSGATSDKSFLDHLIQTSGPLRKPDWATSHGIDEHGWWATLQIPNAPPQRMRFIPPGEFWMGSPLAEDGRWDDETLHPVTLTLGFWLGETTVSNALWGAVMGKAAKGEALHPTVEVSWDDIQKQFLPALRRQTGETDHSYWQLPSEAQWEYAARAGTQTAYPWGDTPDETRMNVGNRLMPVDTGCPPNPWGLLHMHGNVWEWCRYTRGPLSPAPALDPLHEDRKASGRVLRGGSWIYDARSCRSAVRFGGGPGNRSGSIGFRLARGLEPASAQAEPGRKPAKNG